MEDNTIIIAQLKTFTFNEVKRALSEGFMIVIRRDFSDKWDAIRVKECIHYLKQRGLYVAVAQSYLQTAESERLSNYFDASSMIPRAVSTVVVGNKTLTYQAPKPKVINEVPTSHFYVGGVQVPSLDVIPPPLPIALRTLACAVSTTGQTTKRKAPSSPFPGVIPSSLAHVAIDTFEGELGKEEDVLVKVMTKLRAPDKQEKKKDAISSVAMFVPTETMVQEGKLIKAPLYPYKGKEYLKFDYKFSHTYYSPKRFFAIFDTMGSVLSKKGQGKWAADSYLGVPLSDFKRYANHKITLDDAGVIPGDSIFVNTTDTVLVMFLRSNYGEYVYGKGSIQPMLRAEEYEGKKFKWVYVPKHIKTSLSGSLTNMMNSLKSSYEKHLNLEVHGRLIAYISPLCLMIPSMENVIFRASQKLQYREGLEEDSVTTIKESFPMPREHKTYGAISDFSRILTHTYPENVSDVEHLIDNALKVFVQNKPIYATYVKDKWTDDEKAVVFEAFKKSAEYHTLRREINSKNRNSYNDSIKSRYLDALIPDCHILAMNSLPLAAAPISISVDSWKQVFLYVEEGEKKKYPPLSESLSLLASYCRHCIRGVWFLQPYSLSNYVINKVKAKPKNIPLDFLDGFDTVFAQEILEALNDEQREEAHEYQEASDDEESGREEEVPDNQAPHMDEDAFFGGIEAIHKAANNK
jgi:hypothetical protein